MLTATAAVAAMGDAKVLKSGREFAAWLGLVSRQTGSGGKINLHGISRRGDADLRTLLIHGARAVYYCRSETCPWLVQVSQRRAKNVVIVAQANKIVRTIWAVLVREQAYQANHISIRP
ncbi:hypothetical protein BI344_16190 [Chromobacterium sphagni]|uniref:Transposase IS116/IS110/IS902 C-terminal domain-containing protein n=1 Tax=Chromobacterium sphagni TaxID=1903179 RepID=A0ABX3CC56_9NEIS|nr:hypothetical protein BI344_16190 [Chromobacterium sphagni]